MERWNVTDGASLARLGPSLLVTRCSSSRTRCSSSAGRRSSAASPARAMPVSRGAAESFLPLNESSCRFGAAAPLAAFRLAGSTVRPRGVQQRAMRRRRASGACARSACLAADELRPHPPAAPAAARRRSHVWPRRPRLRRMGAAVVGHGGAGAQAACEKRQPRGAPAWGFHLEPTAPRRAAAAPAEGLAARHERGLRRARASSLLCCGQRAGVIAARFKPRVAWAQRLRGTKHACVCWQHLPAPLHASGAQLTRILLPCTPPRRRRLLPP